MSKSSFSNLSEFEDTTLGWATGQCILPTRKQRNALFDLLFTRFGKTSRRAARAVRDFVTCSSPQSSGFSARQGTAGSQESPGDLRDSQEYETTSTTSNLQTPRGKSESGVWSNRNETPESLPHGISRQPPWGSAHDQGARNGESNLWPCGAEVTSTSNCGPKLPSNFWELPTRQRLRAVKKFLASFSYKPNSEPSLNASKQRPLSRIMATARRIVYKPEPIKSMEAVFLALYLTAGLLSVDRIPVGFKTKFGGEVSGHTVVLVQYKGKYGAFGIGPNPDFMTKDLHFDSLSSIIENYVKTYQARGHIVLRIRIGLRVEHDMMSPHFICWRHLCLSPDSKSWAECVVDIENHVLRMRHLWDIWMLTGKVKDPHKAGKTEKLDPSTFTSRGKAMSKPGVALELKKHVDSTPRECPHPEATMVTQRHWDTESTGSNTEECEHCEQLKRAMPPGDTKCTTVTTMKRMKTSTHQDTRCTPKFKTPGPKFTPAPSDSQQRWEAESYESNTGDPSQQPSSQCKAKQILNQLVSSRAMSTTISRRPTNGCGSKKSITRNADSKSQVIGSGRRKPTGPLYTFSSGGKKSKAG